MFVELKGSKFEGSRGVLETLIETQMSIHSSTVILPVRTFVSLFSRIVANGFVTEASYDWVVLSNVLEFIVNCRNVRGLIWLRRERIFGCFFVL